jgi:hypothetical protein
MADGIDARASREEPFERPIQFLIGEGRQIVASLHPLGGVEHPELEAAGAGVHDEHLHPVSLAVSREACHLDPRGDHRP